MYNNNCYYIWCKTVSRVLFRVSYKESYSFECFDFFLDEEYDYLNNVKFNADLNLDLFYVYEQSTLPNKNCGTESAWNCALRGFNNNICQLRDIETPTWQKRWRHERKTSHLCNTRQEPVEIQV